MKISEKLTSKDVDVGLSLVFVSLLKFLTVRVAWLKTGPINLNWISWNFSFHLLVIHYYRLAPLLVHLLKYQVSHSDGLKSHKCCTCILTWEGLSPQILVE